jgi:hypothetical protein
VMEAVRRLARARSSRTAAVAVTRAAATAMRVICQPGMPPPVITGAGMGTAAGTGPERKTQARTPAAAKAHYLCA